MPIKNKGSCARKGISSPFSGGARYWKVCVIRIVRGRVTIDSHSRAAVSAQGFTVIEILIALTILTFGLLAAGQLMFLAASAESLARSKGTASVVAQDRLEALADLYRRNDAAAELTAGDHDPVQVRVLNPTNNREINRYDVAWNVTVVPDPRGRVLRGRLVRVTVTPINMAGTVNSRTSLNKIVNMTTIFSARVQ